MENGNSLPTSRRTRSSTGRDRSSTGQTSSNATQNSRVSRPLPENIFNDNVHRIIDNPMAHWLPGEAEGYARKFAQERGLEPLTDLFVKAALILRDPIAWRSLKDRLTAADEAALEADNRSRRHITTSLKGKHFPTSKWWKSLWNEAFLDNGFWQQPKQLKATTITLCVAAVAQGWCQAGSNGANLNWGQALLPDASSREKECDPSKWAWNFALINAAPYLSASLAGCWLSDPLSERFVGRRIPIAISAVFILGPAIGSGLCTTWSQLLACRFLLGLGMGCKAAVVPVYAAEIAPSHLRGSLVMNWQLFDALGIFLGFTANLIASVAGKDAWRWQFASAAIPALVLLGQIYSSPESPRFLMKQDKYADAYDSLLQLRGKPILTAKELLYTHVQMETEEKLLHLAPKDVEAQRSHSWVTPTRWSIYARKLRLIFAKRRTRRAAVAAMVCMIGQQLCGVNILEFFSSTLYADASHRCGEAYRKDPAHHLAPLLLTWGVGLANFLFTFPAYWLIDRKGRRWLLLVTLPFMAIFMLGAALSFEIDEKSHQTAQLVVITIFTYLFMFFYSWGMGPVPFTYSAEIFPLEVRMVGMSFSVFVNFLGASALALFVPALTVTRMRHTGLLGMFAGFNVLTFVLVFLFVPETANASIGVKPENDLGSLASMSLEELSYIFGIPTRVIMKIHLKMLKYRWNYYVRRRKEFEKPEDMYHLPIYKGEELETLEEQEQEQPILDGDLEAGRR